MTILTGPVTLGAFPRSPASSISASSVPGKESIFTKKEWTNYSQILLTGSVICKPIMRRIVKWLNWLLKKHSVSKLKQHAQCYLFSLKTTNEKS